MKFNQEKLQRLGLAGRGVAGRMLKAQTNAALRATMAEPDLMDARISFGQMMMPLGRAFQSGASNSAAALGVPVAKQLVSQQGRTVLLESVEWQAVQAQLEQLPKLTASVASPIWRAGATRELPQPLVAAASRVSEGFATRWAEVTRPPKTTLLAVGPRPASPNAPSGLVMDCELVESCQDYTFENGTTYLVASVVYLSGTTTFDGAHVIKYRPFPASVQITDTVSNDGATTYCTAVDDDSVGDTIDGSTGNPEGSYGTTAVEIEFIWDTSFAPSSMEFRYCYGGLYVDAGWGSVVLPTASFTHVSVGVSPGGSVGITLGNVYVCFVNCLYDLRDSGRVSLTRTLSGCPEGMDVDVTQDLLLVYNSSSTDSGTVKDYYLQHRPMVNGAMVMSISVPTINETVLTNDITTLIVQPIADWLSSHGNKQPKYIVLFPDIPTRVNESNSPFYLGDTRYEYNQGAHRRESVGVQITNAFSWKPYVTYISMGTVAACEAYIGKLEQMGKLHAQHSPGKVIISASSAGYSNGKYYFDDSRNSGVWSVPPSIEWGYDGRSGVIGAGVPSPSVTYVDTEDDTPPTGLTYHITAGSDVSGYLCWGGDHSNLGYDYAVVPRVTWSGNSGWWLIQTVESSNGQRYQTDYANFTLWFSAGAFIGGSSFAATPVGAVTHVDEPGIEGINDASVYFGYWASGQTFANCAWASRRTEYFAAFGDPLVSK